MNTESLLDAIGLIDDDLILDAEQPSARPKVVPLRKKWASWAACLAVVVVLGYGVTHLPLMGMKSDSASAGAAAPSAPAASAPAASAPAAEAPSEPEPSSPSASIATGDHPDADLTGFRVMVTVDGLTYAYLHTYPYEESHGAWVDTLPDGCQAVGHVEPIDGDVTVPHTDIGVYEGCALWLEGEGRDSTLYLELPEGGYLVCEYSQTYEFSPDGRG